MKNKTTGLIIELTGSGMRFADSLEEHEDCLNTEREFFETVRKIPETKIEELLDWETKS
jgi:hypothetical protein